MLIWEQYVDQLVLRAMYQPAGAEGNVSTSRCWYEGNALTREWWGQYIDQTALRAMYWPDGTEDNALTRQHWGQCNDQTVLRVIIWWDGTDLMVMHQPDGVELPSKLREF